MRHWTPCSTLASLMAVIGRELAPGNVRSGQETGKRGENG